MDDGVAVSAGLQTGHVPGVHVGNGGVLIVTVVWPDLVGSCTDVAVIVAVPVFPGAVY